MKLLKQPDIAFLVETPFRTAFYFDKFQSSKYPILGKQIEINYSKIIQKQFVFFVLLDMFQLCVIVVIDEFLLSTL